MPYIAPRNNDATGVSLPKIVWVEWDDPTTYRGWQFADDEDVERLPIPGRSIGFLMQETKDWIKISHSYDTNDGAFVDSFVIPKGAIKAWGEVSLSWR